MPIESHQQALDFWHNRINYEQRGMPLDLRELRLDRMRALLEQLGNPHERLQIVHIAGSKGKGSTAAMLAAVLGQAGYRTGLFTSPHLCRVEERVQIDGRPIEAPALTRLMQKLEPAVLALEAQGSPPTFFEIVTALGFLHFAGEQVDWAVLEVGLGGQFDSTNVCTPRVAVITSISFDHTEQLGPTLAHIAREKAGIIKPGMPVVHGVEAAEARAVIEQVAQEQRCRVCAVGRHFTYRHEPGWVDALGTRRPRVQVQTSHRAWPSFELALLGQHQALNAAVVVACLEVLQQQGLAVPDSAVATGLREVVWPARMEVVSRKPLVVLDCAHNVASIQALLDTLRTSFPPARRGLIFAGSRDKDLHGMLRLLASHFEKVWFTRYAGSRRGADAEELAALWQEVGGGPSTIAATPADAWQAARAWAQSADHMIVTGSVFLAGELRPLLVE